MADVLTKEQRHKNMKNIWRTDTKIEIILRKALWEKDTGIGRITVSYRASRILF